MDTEPAFLSDELDLTESDKASGWHDLATAGVPTKAELLATVEREGKVEGILEAARLLSLEEYREIEAAWKLAPTPKLPKIRRRTR